MKRRLTNIEVSNLVNMLQKALAHKTKYIKLGIYWPERVIYYETQKQINNEKGGRE